MTLKEKAKLFPLSMRYLNTNMWFKYLLIGIYVFIPLSNIAGIGEERKPVTKEGAITSVILSGLLIAGIIHYF